MLERLSQETCTTCVLLAGEVQASSALMLVLCGVLVKVLQNVGQVGWVIQCVSRLVIVYVVEGKVFFRARY